MGAEAFAKRVLITAFQGDEKVTNLEQIWAQGETTYPVDFGEITGRNIRFAKLFKSKCLACTIKKQ